MQQNPDKSQTGLVSVFVREIGVHVRIGLEPREREARQRLLVTVELFTDPLYLQRVQEETIIDYAAIVFAVRQWEQRPHVGLIETYVRELLDLSFSDRRVEACRVSVSKPDIFEEAAAAGVEAFMDRADYEKLQQAPRS